MSPVAALLLLAGVTVAVATAASASPCGPATISGPSRAGGILGIVRPVRTAASGGCGTSTPTGTEDPYNTGGAPPLLNHGGNVMSTAAVGGKVVLTPIYWAPTGYSFTTSYKNLINTYLADMAHDSGASTNVFATLPQYPGSNGTIVNGFAVGAAITDTNAYPSAGCPFVSGSVYSDGSGITTCLTDTQLKAQIDTVAGAAPRDLGHMYLIFTPKGVQSCFDAAGSQCSINAGTSSAFCAYHSGFFTGAGETIYANQPFPVYSSNTGYSCTEESLDGLGGPIQHPNGDTDADVEVSPLSHEMAEAITDPEGQTWYDAAGFENGDDCAYIYGSLSGAAGLHYNQTINGRHYLTQEEFSNAVFVPLVSGCLQQVSPTVTVVAPNVGPLAGGQTVTVTGNGFTGATAVRFGATAAVFTVNSGTSITATSPAHASGHVDVTVTTPGGTSSTGAGDKYTYRPVPTITRVSPNAGPVAGGRTVTITGTGFTGTTKVTFGSSPATNVVVTSDTSLTARSPAHVAGTVNVYVTTAGGHNVAVTADRYTYRPVPTITSVSPSSGSHLGGQTVTITGTGFTGTTKVSFGSSLARFTVVSSTRITARTPAHAAGTVNVYVTTAGGHNAAVTADRYRYL